MLKKNLLGSNSHISEVLQVSRIPITLWIGLVYIGALVLQYLEKYLPYQTILFTLVIVIHTVFYWFSNLLTIKRKWPYFLIQGALVFISTFFIPEGSIVILIGLLPILIAQSITVFQHTLKIIIIFMIFYFCYCLVIWNNYGPQELPIFILILFLILTIVIFYSVLYNRQVNARLRMESYLQELELAHQKVEELTLSNERQRMARDLHDTLAQGLAGIIMQLEAVQAHLQKGNTIRCEEIIQKSMNQARETLHSARIAIDNLRATSMDQVNFYHSVVEMINKFKESFNCKISYEVDRNIALTTLAVEHSLFIISECLVNVARHSQAEMVQIKVKTDNNFLSLEVKDDGIGFIAEKVGKNVGKYGLLGLQERVRLLSGTITINSRPGLGTKVSVMIPI
jgi:two-component system, NarL family, sensor histidine kinase YdfH